MRDTRPSLRPPRPFPARTALCVLLAAALLACTGGSEDAASDGRVVELEARARSLEESVQDLAEENADLRSEITALRQAQAGLVEAREAADAAREHEEEVADFEEGQEAQLGALEEGQVRTGKRLDDMDARLRDLERVASIVEPLLPIVEQWTTGKGSSQPESSVLESTVRLAEDSGAQVHYVDHPQRKDRSVLITPLEFVDGETPLIVSLHGYGGNSADHAAYVPLHQRVNKDGFALLLPNGTLDAQGNRFWNPTDRCCESGKTGEDDVAYLTGLVEEARKVREFGPVYFFGYSNGGFMSYHMACKGLPGLRAVASLAGTSYVEDSSCDGAHPVSVLHVHGTSDSVILFEGARSEPDPKGDGDPAFYAGAEEMVARWSQRAGCAWPEHPQPYATLDLDQYVPGPETQAFRAGLGCAQGIDIELWTGAGSGHSPGYGDDFVGALVGWLLSQE